MEKSRRLKSIKKNRDLKLKKKLELDIHKYIDEKLEELSWNMGERKIRNREELHDR